MLEYLRHCTPEPIVVSASGRTLLWILSHATTRIILSRVRDEGDITAVELAALHRELAGGDGAGG